MVSIDIARIAQILLDLASYQPDAILQKARDYSFDPRQAYVYYLVYLSRAGFQKNSEGVTHSINFLLDHCSTRRIVDPGELITGGNAQRDGDSVVLVNDDNLWSDAIINFELGDRLLWGLRYLATIESGTEIKLEVADLVFAINTEDYPFHPKTKIFRWDRVHNNFAGVIQTSDFVARRNYPMLVNLFLWDKSLWYTVNDKVIFTCKLSALDRENWCTSKPRFITWNSCARVGRISLFDFNDKSQV